MAGAVDAAFPVPDQNHLSKNRAFSGLVFKVISGNVSSVESSYGHRQIKQMSRFFFENSEQSADLSARERAQFRNLIDSVGISDKCK